MIRRTMLLILAVLAMGGPARAEFVVGWVQAREGDTFRVATIEDDRRKTRYVRFADIEFPLAPQHFGDAAEAEIDGLLLHRVVLVVLRGTDAEGRGIGTFFFDRANVNERLVLHGLAKPTAHCEDQLMPDLQAASQAGGRGMWAVPAPDHAPPRQ